MPRAYNKEDVTKSLIDGLRWLASQLEDGLVDFKHWEHYSETAPSQPKLYHLHMSYIKVGPDYD